MIPGQPTVRGNALTRGDCPSECGMRILAHEERRAAGGMMAHWGAVMEFLDAALSLAVGFCLTGGLFWLVSRMKGCQALRNIGDPNFAPYSVPYPVSHACEVEKPYSIHVRPGQIATCAHPDGFDRIDSCARPSTPTSNPARQAKASSKVVPGSRLRRFGRVATCVQEKIDA